MKGEKIKIQPVNTKDVPGEIINMKKIDGAHLFGITPDGQEVMLYTLRNRHGMVMTVINYGCTITSLMVPDRNGVFENIVLGFDHLEAYLQSEAYIGCIVGRYANRIARGTFSMEGNEYLLAANQKPHHLHGGVIGFDKVVWKAEPLVIENGSGIVFKHTSPNADEGYPGNLSVEVKYILGDDNSLSFEYRAITDQITIINLTQHSYFNLNGGKREILNHDLRIEADHFLPVDLGMIPTGEIRSVDNTPFDFRTSKRIGAEINTNDDQLVAGNGYDHCWVIRPSTEAMQHAAGLYDHASGRSMEVFTSEPGIQVYTANFLDEKVPGMGDILLQPRSGVCLETQHFPDSPNQGHFPSTVLHPGEQYFSKTLFRFGVKK